MAQPDRPLETFITLFMEEYEPDRCRVRQTLPLGG
jgi:hypothetical protein